MNDFGSPIRDGKGLLVKVPWITGSIIHTVHPGNETVKQQTSYLFGKRKHSSSNGKKQKQSGTNVATP